MSEKRLDAKEQQNVQYCVSLWLRDQQIRVNTARVKGRIAAHYDLWSEPIAIVCYGPSLNETWEEVKKFKYIMTCSGAHRFLIDRGIIPTWHVEVDPREHKIKLVGEPHKDVTYLIASTCHPKYFEHLESFRRKLWETREQQLENYELNGAESSSCTSTFHKEEEEVVGKGDVKLWHVFDPNEDALRVLPHGEWALTGGCGAGLRAMTIARFFGFTDQHIFGMDGSEGETGKHASDHPNQATSHSICSYGGVDYRTTPAFLEAARQTWHELDQMSDVKAKFYGEGLVQAMAKDYVRKPASTVGIGANIAFSKPALISPDYRALNARLHEENLGYGVGGARHSDTIIKLADSLKTRSVLDYGCGKGQLAKSIPWPIWEYDPAIPGKEESPRPADLVVCTDVLEHIEPDKIEFVLDDLRRCTKQLGYFVIHTGPSKKTLADGRNAHLIQHGKDWWEARLSKYFNIGKIFPVGIELYVVVTPKVMGVKKKVKKVKKVKESVK